MARDHGRTQSMFFRPGHIGVRTTRKHTLTKEQNAILMHVVRKRDASKIMVMVTDRMNPLPMHAHQGIHDATSTRGTKSSQQRARKRGRCDRDCRTAGDRIHGQHGH